MSDLLRPLIHTLSDGQFHSGTELGKTFAISRAAVWKYIQKMNDLGLEIHSVRGKGYRMPQPVGLLDDSVIASLDTESDAGILQHLEILDSTDSTNSHAMRCLQQGNLVMENGRYAVFLAERQTRGKGRRGRQWVSPYGRNVYLTLVRLVDAGATGTEGMSLVVGLAVIRALKHLGVHHAGVKWPNDVVCEGKKLAGILLEITGDVTGVCQLLIGIGINTRCPPESMDGVDQPWTDLYQLTGQETDRNQLVTRVITEVMAVMAEFEHSGMAAFLEEWKRHDVMYGKQVELTTAGSSRTGRALGIAETGALVLETAEGQILVSGGEISLREKSAS